MNKWFEKQRQDYIEKSIKVIGQINRWDLMDYFNVSATTATRDLTLFRKNNPEALVYDVTRKCYIAKDKPCKQ